MSKIKFNAQLINSGKRIRSISGKLGPFVFRTYTGGIIKAYYKQPKNDSPSVHSRSIIESLSVQLREIAEQLGLTITRINCDY